MMFLFLHLTCQIIVKKTFYLIICTRIHAELESTTSYQTRGSIRVFHIYISKISDSTNKYHNGKRHLLKKILCI